jgi:predicted transcriptional regulator YdeE
MALNEKPDVVTWPATHFVFVEKTGPFSQTAQKAWQMVYAQRSEIAAQVGVESAMSLYRVNPEMVYRAGVIVDAEPRKLPDGFSYAKLEGGNYARFTLTGSYSQLPQASGRVFELMKGTQIVPRDGFKIEHYANDPRRRPRIS